MVALLPAVVALGAGCEIGQDDEMARPTRTVTASPTPRGRARSATHPGRQRPGLAERRGLGRRHQAARRQALRRPVTGEHRRARARARRRLRAQRGRALVHRPATTPGDGVDRGQPRRAERRRRAAARQRLRDREQGGARLRRPHRATRRPEHAVPQLRADAPAPDPSAPGFKDYPADFTLAGWVGDSTFYGVANQDGKPTSVVQLPGEHPDLRDPGVDRGAGRGRVPPPRLARVLRGIAARPG